MDTEEIKKQIVADLKIDNLPDSLQNDIIEKLGQNVLQRVTLEILKQIPKEHHNEFDTISDSGDPDKIRSFIEQFIPNLDEFTKQVTAKEIIEFKALANIS